MTDFSETFRWDYYVFDVTKINTDIARGGLIGARVVLSRSTIEWYSNHVLSATHPEARRFPQLRAINTTYAKELTPARVDEPVILAQIERSFSAANELSAGLEVAGVLGYASSTGQIVKPDASSEADILVLDGNHRIVAAYYQRRGSVTGILLKRTC